MERANPVGLWWSRDRTRARWKRRRPSRDGERNQGNDKAEKTKSHEASPFPVATSRRRIRSVVLSVGLEAGNPPRQNRASRSTEVGASLAPPSILPRLRHNCLEHDCPPLGIRAVLGSALATGPRVARSWTRRDELPGEAGICAVPADDRVAGAVAAVEVVVSVAARQRVVARKPVERVVQGIALQVVAEARSDDVLDRADHVGA